MYKTLWKEIMTEDLRRIEYRFLHWGLFVCHYALTPEEIKEFKSLESGKDYNLTWRNGDEQEGAIYEGECLVGSSTFLRFSWVNEIEKTYIKTNALVNPNSLNYITRTEMT